MKCPETRNMVSPYLDDELRPDKKREFTAHLERCPGCRKAVEEAEQVQRLFASVERFEAPVGFVDRVMARVEEGEEPWFTFFIRLPGGRSFFLRTAEIAFALVIVLIGALSGSLLMANRTAEGQPTVQESFSLDLFRATPPDSMGGAYMRLAGVADEK